MSKNKFNNMIGISGTAGVSNLTGDYSQLLSGISSGSALSGGSTLLANTGTIFSNVSVADQSSQMIALLQAERTTVANKLTTAQTELARLVSIRGNCKGAFGIWNNGCLDNNTALQNQQKTIISTCEARLIAIDAEISKIQTEAAAIRQAEQEAAAKAAALAQQAAEQKALAAAQAASSQIAVIQAEAMANPETAAILKNAEIALAQAKENTKVMIAGGIAALLVLIGLLYFIFK